jgi:hypothetical protein
MHLEAARKIILNLIEKPERMPAGHKLVVDDTIGEDVADKSAPPSMDLEVTVHRRFPSIRLHSWSISKA